MNSNTANPNDFPLYLFYQGKNSEGYKFFGAHPVEENGEKKHRFRVWAPNAVSVSVVGDFNAYARQVVFGTKNSTHDLKSSYLWFA